MRSHMKPAMLLLSMIGVLAAVSVAHANLITNESFETPVVAPGGFTTFPPGSALIPGWNVVGPAGTAVAIVSGTFSQLGVSFPAQAGSQWLDLTGSGSNSTEGVAQSVATIPGHAYQVSYFIGNTTGGSIFGTTSTVNLLVDGAPAFTDTNSNASPTTLDWEQFTHTVTATGSTTALSFLNGDPGGDNSNGLDNILVLDLGPASAVPEPASLVLFGSSLLGLGAIWRRKAK